MKIELPLQNYVDSAYARNKIWNIFGIHGDPWVAFLCFFICKIQFFHQICTIFHILQLVSVEFWVRVI